MRKDYNASQLVVQDGLLDDVVAAPDVVGRPAKVALDQALEEVGNYTWNCSASQFYPVSVTDSGLLLTK